MPQRSYRIADLVLSFVRLTNHWLRFALFFPIAQLLVWLVLVPVPALLFYARLGELKKTDGRIHLQTKNFEVAIRPDNRLLFAFGTTCEQRFKGILSIDLPGVIIGAPLTIPAVQLLRRNFIPWGIHMWYVLTLPFFNLPVWWWIGRTYDRFRARKRLQIWQAVFAFFLGAACLASAIALIVTPRSEDESNFFPGAVLWSGLFLTVPLVWALQKKIRVPKYSKEIGTA